MMRRLLALVCICLAISCGGDGKKNNLESVSQKDLAEKQAKQTKNQSSKPAANSIRTATTDENGVKKFTMKEPSKNTSNRVVPNKPKMAGEKRSTSVKSTLPDPCSLMDRKLIAQLMKVPEMSVTVNDGTGGDVTKSRACFFKWDETSVKSAGAMVNVQINPVETEAPDYFTRFIDSKISSGEKDFHSDDPIKFKRWKHVGTAGAYSNKAKKYFWRVDNKYCFMIAFNSGKSEKEIQRAAEALSSQVMKKMGL